MKIKKTLKGGQANIRYPGFCDNNPSQCMEIIGKCSGGKRKKSIKKKKGGQYATVLKGSNKQGVMVDGQTPSEIKQFGLLPGNDWAIGLGENPGVTAQMQADASGPGQAGGKKFKGGYSSLGFKTYPSWCDGKENWSQCGISSTACGSSGGRKKSKKNSKQKKNKHGGQYATVLKGSNKQGVMIDGQTPSEIKQFGLLPGNDWAIGLGENPGVTAQMQADASGPGQAGGKRSTKGGYSSLGFKTYPSWCDGKENWSQCGISNTACGSSGGKKKYKRNKKGGNGNTQFEIKGADEEIFNGIYKKTDVNDLSDNLKDNDFIKDFISANTNNGRISFGIVDQEGTLFVKEDNHAIIIYYFNYDNPGTWFIQNLQNGVEDQFTYLNGDISEYNEEKLPKQGWIKNGGRLRDTEVPNLEVISNN